MPVRRRLAGSLVPLILTVAAALAGCDLAPRSSANPARDRWTEVSPVARTRIADLRSRQTVLAGRIGALNLPPGVQDAALASQFADLQARVATLEPVIGDLERDNAVASAEVEAALAGPDKIRARQAVEAGVSRMDQTYARAQMVFNELEPMVPAAEQALQRHLVTAQAEEQRFYAIATTGGSIELPSVAFAGDTAELDVNTATSRAELDRLVRLAAACAEIRLTIGARVAGPDAAVTAQLSRARAEAVRTYLANASVPAERMSVTAKPAAAPAAAARNAITVEVAPCPRPGAAPAAAVPAVP